MKLVILSLFCVFTAFSQEIVIKNEWGKYFKEKEVKGSFVLFDQSAGNYKIYDLERASRGFISASTFKIPNTLIGLETGVITGEDFTLKWDGKNYALENWNRDHNLASAFKYSVVWYYQEVARRIGSQDMQKYLDMFNYGNKDISGGIDRFWLTGAIRISALEQVDFLKKIYYAELPVSARSLEVLKKIMIYESTENYTMRAKTGWAVSSDMTGWFVGYVEKADNVYFFALNIEAPEGKANFAADRISITKEILKEEKIID